MGFHVRMGIPAKFHDCSVMLTNLKGLLIVNDMGRTKQYCLSLSVSNLCLTKERKKPHS